EPRDQRVQPLPWRTGHLPEVLERHISRREGLCNQGVIERFFARKVVVDQPVTDSSGFGHVADGGRETLLREYLRRRRQDLRTLGFPKLLVHVVCARHTAVPSR